MSKTKTKRYLMLLAAIGLIAAGLGGTGTFASFNAEVTNNGNYFATGSLLLHDNGGTNTCTSEADTSQNANNATTNGCDVLFNFPVSDQSPHFASLTLTNAGTLDASDIKWDTPTPCSTGVAGVNATLTTGLSGTVSTLAITSLQGSAAGSSVTVTYGGHSQTFTTSAAPLGSNSITVTGSPTANFAYPVGSAVHVGSSPTFNGPTFNGGSDLCPNLQVVVIETDSSLLRANAIGCAYGTANVNDCTFDSSHTLGTGINDVPSSLTNLSLATGGPNTNALDAGNSRYFLIGVQLAPSADNSYQNRSASFDLRWHIDS